MKGHVPMTVRAPGDLYQQFHSIACSQGATHNGIMIRMMEMYVKSEGNLVGLERLHLGNRLIPPAPSRRA